MIISNSIDNFGTLKKYLLKDQKQHLTHDHDYNDIIFNDDFKYLLINDLNDKIVLHEKINNLIDIKENLDIKKLTFENSKHVQHFRYNEEEYVSELNSYILDLNQITIKYLHLDLHMESLFRLNYIINHY